MAVSVVIPTRNERGNASALLHRLSDVLASEDEVIIVDDGDDDLPSVVERESAQYPQQIQVFRRSSAVGGLGGAVVEGIRRASGDVVVVCDGDLQHPPEAIPAMLAALTDADVVVASRYCLGGSADGLSGGWRRIASRATGSLSRIVFPIRLRSCLDPMSGFFALQRSAIKTETLRPRGFKILLEILVRSSRLRIVEVPFTFADRSTGVSHATYREGMRFVGQLLSARVPSRATHFLLIGLSGVLPNLVAVWLLTGQGLHYLLAAAIATQVAITWNFLGAELLVWRDHRAGDWKARFAKYSLIGETDLLRLPFVALLVSGLRLSTVAATMITLVAAFVFRFILIDKLIYRQKSDANEPYVDSLSSRHLAAAAAKPLSPQSGIADVDTAAQRRLEPWGVPPAPVGSEL